jgi:murein DD-endopeptidase MepM/ murein hydrolase activator NlpD
MIEPRDDNAAEIDAAHAASVAAARTLGLDRAGAPRINNTGSLLFPLRLRPNAKAFRGNGISNFVDLDGSPALKDFACGQRTYDGHRGIDFPLYPYWWRMVDGRDVEIVAAAPGTIVNKNDGAFDRQCALNGAPANSVSILQDDGLYAFYWHMKKGSVTKRPVGARVAAGEVLGLVASSGNSTGPHLHFELRTQSGVTVDPFAGKCGAKTTRWSHQPEDLDTDILRIATHAVQPPAMSACGNPNPRYATRFAPGASVWGTVYIRDMPAAAQVVLSIVRPNGQTFASWTPNPLGAVFRHVYWWGAVRLPTAGANGTWKVRAKLEGRTMESAFVVGTLPAATTLNVSALPAARVLPANATAFFDVTVRNTGVRTAVGCTIAPDVPLAAVWNVRQLVPAAPATDLNRVFDLVRAARKTFRLAIKPKPGYKAKAIRIPIRVFCLNANSPAAANTNTVTLTF